MTTARIDAHQHFWDPAAFDYPWMAGPELDPVRRPFTPADLAPHLVANAVEGTVLVQTVSDAAETEQFLELARTTDFVRGVVGWADLTDRAVADRLSALVDRHRARLVGIRHQVHDEPDPRWLDRPEVRAGVEAVGRAGLAFDVLVRTRELPAAIRLAADLPDQRFVLDHIAKPPLASGRDEEWFPRIARLAQQPNVAVKLSGIVTEATWDDWTVDTFRPYVDHVLECFGADRILFGSDWPVCLLAASDYSQVVDTAAELLSSLSHSEQADIFGGNARLWYRLDRD